MSLEHLWTVTLSTGKAWRRWWDQSTIPWTLPTLLPLRGYLGKKSLIFTVIGFEGRQTIAWSRHLDCTASGGRKRSSRISSLSNLHGSFLLYYWSSAKRFHRSPLRYTCLGVRLGHFGVIGEVNGEGGLTSLSTRKVHAVISNRTLAKYSLHTKPKNHQEQRILNY
jgi:hypothetical protein